MKAVRILAAAFLVSACASLEAKPSYLIGGWGGPHIGITFEGGLANVELDCASGTIDRAVYPAKSGEFSAKGTFRAGTPGPVRVGQIYRSQPATYSGTVVKDVMTLQIKLEDGTIGGPFTLARAAEPQLTRCL